MSTSSQAKRASPDTASGLLTGLSNKIVEVERAIERQAHRFRGVLDIGTALSSTRDLDALLRLVMDRLTALIDAEASTLFMLDEERGELWSRVLKGASLKEIRFPADKGIAGTVLAEGKTVVIGDAYGDARFNPEIDRQSGFKTRSIIAAPLRHVSGSTRGVLEVLHRRANAFDEEDAAMVEAVATQVAAVLDNVLLWERLRSRNEELTAAKEQLSEALEELDLLYEVERAVSSSASQSELLEQILRKAMGATGATAGSILLKEEDQGSLYFRSARGEKSDALVSLTLKVGQGIAGRVAETGKSIRTDEADSLSFHERSIPKKLGVAVRAVLCVPVPGEGGVLGSLELLNKKGGFSEDDERLATLLAGQTGRAIMLRSARDEGERRSRLAAVGQMLSGVLHDLRTPMTIISGYSQMLAGELPPDERQEVADVIERQVEHVNAMTRETLAFARGEQALLLGRIYMQRFVEEVEAFLRKDFEQSKVELKVNPVYTGTLRADENKLKRIVYNIARNAAQAMPEGGRFTFTVDREGDEVLMKFQDNGPGIPKEIQETLFDSFVTMGKETGTGLGLAVVKKLTDEHGGTVSFKSRTGRGTTFEVRIPARTRT